MPNSNYYDNVLAQILGSGLFGTNEQASARTMASEAEDEMLRGRMGSKTKRSKRDRRPTGAYSESYYPGLGGAMDWASTGATPGGSAHIGMWLKEQGDMGLRDENARRRMEWAMRQRQLLGGW